LLLLPGDFPLSFLEGKFCPCHGPPPFSSLPRSGNDERKKEAPRKDSHAPECLCGYCVKTTRVLRFRLPALFGPGQHRNLLADPRPTS
jgi:hypothetical protein